MSFNFKSLSVFKIIALALAFLCLVMLFLPWISMSAMGQSESVSIFNTGINGNVSSFWSVFLIIFAIVAILAILAAAYGVLTDKIILALPLPVLALVMFLLAFFQKLHIKNVIKKELGSFSDLGDLIRVHVGVGGWLFLLFALGCFGVLFYEDYATKKNSMDLSKVKETFSKIPLPNMTKASKTAGWTCPNCGTKCADDQNFCKVCGTKKPEPRRCPGCGAEINAQDTFCTNCGTRL